MWTGELIAQAIGWGVLIAGFPFIFIYARKVALHISYVLYPRNMLIQYKNQNNKIESYILKQSIFRPTTLTQVSEETARVLGGDL